MDKKYSITFQTYHNERLKEISFHGKVMRPLYVRLIFDRVPIYFKSFFFDLFSQPRYGLEINNRIFGPDIKDIIEKEEALVSFVIEKHIDNFSHEQFKISYAYYGRDLLNMMEEAFIDYLYHFFADEGIPYFASVLRNGLQEKRAFPTVENLRLVLKPEQYRKLIENSLYYAPPYLLLHSFIEKPQVTSIPSFTVMDWEQLGIEEKFKEFVKKRHPEFDPLKAVAKIHSYIHRT